MSFSFKNLYYLYIYLYIFSALGSGYEEKVKERIEHVCNEIEEKGHYNLTYEELVFGARMGWRNAPRCVNRIVWRQLEVLHVIEERKQ